MSTAFWRGFWQGLTWPVSWPMMWLLYGIGMLGFWFIDVQTDYEVVPWYHYACFRVYQWGMCTSAFWNDVGGFSLWSKPAPQDSASRCITSEESK